jgi:hypothetical protein
LATVKYLAGDQNFRTAIWSVSGVVFSLVTRPSVKAHSFDAVSNVTVTLAGDPQQPGPKSPDLAEYLPESFLRFWKSNTIGQTVSGWDILQPGETYLIHLSEGDYVVLASRGGAEWLLAPRTPGNNEIHHFLTDGEPAIAGDDFTRAVAG